MAKKKKSSKYKRETSTSFTFPSLHQNVVEAVSDTIAYPWFCENDDDDEPDNEYATHVMGKFRCTSRTCSANVWSSKKVAILIKGYAGNGYNAEVFNQRCRTCNELGTLTLDETSYVERVAYRIQKWAGVRMGPQHYSQRKGMPHEQDFCEGCKRGFCQRKDDGEYN